MKMFRIDAIEFSNSTIVMGDRPNILKPATKINFNAAKVRGVDFGEDGMGEPQVVVTEPTSDEYKLLFELIKLINARMA